MRAICKHFGLIPYCHYFFPHLNTQTVRCLIRGSGIQCNRCGQRFIGIVIPTRNNRSSLHGSTAHKGYHCFRRLASFSLLRHGLIIGWYKPNNIPLKHCHYTQVCCAQYSQRRLPRAGFRLGQRVILIQSCLCTFTIVHDPVTEFHIAVLQWCGSQLHRVTILQACKVAGTCHLSVAGGIGFQRYLDCLDKIRLNSGAGARHSEGERIGSGIIQCHTADLPAGENVARGRHGLNGLLIGAEIHCLTICVSGLAALHAAVFRVNGCNSGILEDDLTRLQHIVLAIYDVEIVLRPIPALAKGIPRLRFIGLTSHFAHIVELVLRAICKHFGLIPYCHYFFPHLNTQTVRCLIRGSGIQCNRCGQRFIGIVIPTRNNRSSLHGSTAHKGYHCFRRLASFSLLRHGLIIGWYKPNNIPLKHCHYTQVCCAQYSQRRLPRAGYSLGQRVVLIQSCLCTFTIVHDPFTEFHIAVLQWCGSQFYRVAIPQARQLAAARYRTIFHIIGLQRYTDAIL